MLASGAANDSGAQCLSSLKALNKPFTKTAKGTCSMRVYGGVEGLTPWDASEALVSPAGVDEDAAAVTSAEEDRFRDRAAIEGMTVHLWESNTIKNVSTAVPTVCKIDTLPNHIPCRFQTCLLYHRHTHGSPSRSALVQHSRVLHTVICISQAAMQNKKQPTQVERKKTQLDCRQTYAAWN